jgi:hypothetical protein
VERFLLRENMRVCRERLACSQDPFQIRGLRETLASAERRLALLQAERFGVQAKPGIAGAFKTEQSARRLAQLRPVLHASPQPHVVIDARPGLNVLELNDAFEQASMASRRGCIGRPSFDVFPDNPERPTADSVANAYAVLAKAAETGRTQSWGLQRYDLRDASGRFIEKYWRGWTTPILDDDRQLMFLVQRIEERPVYVPAECMDDGEFDLPETWPFGRSAA